jgi:hypothetical protein
VKHEKIPVILEELFVEDYATEGKSLAKFNGKVIFIENAVPGDVADVQASRCVFINYRKKELYRFVSILVFAAAASGRCCRTKNN